MVSLSAPNMAEFRILLLALCSFGMGKTEAFLGQLAQNVVTGALTSATSGMQPVPGLAAAGGVQPLTTTGVEAPQAIQNVEPTAGNTRRVRNLGSLHMWNHRKRRQSSSQFCGYRPFLNVWFGHMLHSIL